MSMLKRNSKVAAGIFSVLLVSAAIVYFSYLSPQQRAERHLDFVHQSINEMHPAILEPDATEFLDWHKNGYQKAKELLPHVHTEADEAALLRFYMAGYQDSHLNGHLDKRPFSKLDAEEDLWTGWLLKATNTGYEVIYRKEGDAYPPERAKLISCDGQAIDELLHQHYAPYFDIRWQILKARDITAKAFTQNGLFSSVLNRPDFQTCDFLIDNITKTYPLAWIPINKDESALIAIKSNTQYTLPSISDITQGKLWIRASDFALHTPEAAQSQQKLLDDLALIADVNLIVLDTRGNAGGSSTHGINIFNAIISKDEKAAIYLGNQYQYKDQGSNALFRASWQLYWSYDYALKKLIANQGKEFPDVQYLESFQLRLKQALDAGEKTLYQSETPNKSEAISPPNDEWESNINIVLITDKICVSACLDFVDMVKLVPNLLHLGEPTNADTAYTQIADMQSMYLEETYNFMVPVKKWNKRLRENNQPYIPDVIYEGDMNDDKTLEQWVLAQAEQHFGAIHKGTH
jgi:hypothetical protein